MCGIAGYFEPGKRASSEQLLQMASAIVNRGPDDAGAWVDPDTGLGLAHRRLAIIDLSPAGHQPMQSASGRLVIVFNGEIYNHQALREELEKQGRAPAWQGHSDTETLLAAFDAWGVEQTLKRTIGMFALALWNRHDRCITAGRGRAGALRFCSRPS